MDRSQFDAFFGLGHESITDVPGCGYQHLTEPLVRREPDRDPRRSPVCTLLCTIEFQILKPCAVGPCLQGQEHRQARVLYHPVLLQA